MLLRSTSLALIVAFFAAPAFAGPSGQHSARSLTHSGQAASHGSAAIATGTASVIAVPIFAFGASVAISGAALENVGNGALAVGNDLSRTASGNPVILQRVTPNAPPTLD